MEIAMMQTVLNEVLEELRELKHQQANLTTVVADLNNKVDDFELKLSDIKVTAPPSNLEPVTSTIKEGISRLGGIIEGAVKKYNTAIQVSTLSRSWSDRVL